MLLSLSSCIKEDISSCPPDPQGFQVLFSYLDEGGNDPVHPDELQKASLFVFNEREQCVAFWELNQPQLNTLYRPDIKLMPGNYYFVVWFNLLSPYIIPSIQELIAGKTVRSNEKLFLEIPENRIVNEQEIHLPLSLYGDRDEGIRGTESTVTIPVSQNTNKINISVNGLSPDAHTYRFTIEDDNGIYTFNNLFASCQLFSYVKDATYSSNQLQASLTVLRLAADRPNPVLKIEDVTTGEILFPNQEGITNNLIQLIQLIYPDNDFNKRHVYTLDIMFVGSDIWINGWNLIPSDNNELTPE